MERLQSLLRAAAGRRVTIIGDLMLDGYVEGEVERISPEAPVPVVRITREWSSPGGAGNAALQCAALGADVSLHSVIGDDEAGRSLLAALSAGGVSAQDGISIATDLSTVTKTRIVSGGQQLLRLDREDPAAHAPSSASNSPGGRAPGELLGGADAVVVSDYAKGAVARLLSGAGRPQLAEAARSAGVPLVVDSKDPDPEAHRGCGVATPNRHEAQIILGERIAYPEAGPRAAERLRTLVGCEAVVITLGGWGMAVSSKHMEPLLLPAVATDVSDVTGAGDTVAAVIAVALAGGAGLVEACTIASLAAGVVVRRRFTAQATPTDILALAMSHPAFLG